MKKLQFGKKGLCARGVTKEMNDMEGPELSTNVWHKTRSEISMKATPFLKTKQGLGDLIVEDEALLEMVEYKHSYIIDRTW